MEETTSGSADPLFTPMRALARRGAVIRRLSDGAGVIEQPERQRVPERVGPQAFMRMLEAGWIKGAGIDQFVISKRGATVLRNHLARPRATSGRGVPATGKTAAAAEQMQAGSRQAPGLNPKESPLGWLRQRRDKDGRPMISAVEFEAGERLRADFERGLMAPRVTSSWDPGAVTSNQARGAPGAGMEMSEMVVAARQRVGRALDAVGPELSGMLLDVCCFLKGLEEAERNGGWPRRAGKVVLQLGLAHLARHYGLLTRRDDGGSGPAQVRVWHAAGEAEAAGSASG